MEAYQQRADETMDSLHDAFDDLAEQHSDVDVEYSSGVMTLRLPVGTYVINKQPPNKQIWLSSPESGPKRYDSEGQEWVYARDKSTLRGLLEREVFSRFH